MLNQGNQPSADGILHHSGKDENMDANLVMLASIFSNPSEYSEYGSLGIRSDERSAKEKERIAGRLSGFNPKDNNAWREITQRFGANIKQPELLSIAQVLSSHANIKLDRDAKRRKAVLLKWFEENWLTIKPFLEFVVLEDSRPDTR